MSEPTYTITLSEAERTAMAKVLGALVTKFINAPIAVDAPPSGPGTHPTVPMYQVGMLSPPAAAPAPAPIEQRDRWARDRKGNEAPWPNGCQEREVSIWKTENKGKFLTVTWQAAGPNARGYIDANCFDQKLWPWLIKQVGQLTTLYVQPAKEGKYLNVVGVRA